MTSKLSSLGKRTLQSVRQLELATPSPQLLLSLPPSGWHRPDKHHTRMTSL